MWRTPCNKDHVPSKVLLDRPYPENLPVVFACENCNKSFSLDEEYVACWIEVASRKMYGQKNPSRQKITRIIEKRPSIRTSILDNEGNLISVEEKRLENILIKLAKGHALFELNEPKFEPPSFLNWKVINSLSESERNLFETVPPMSVFPEIGSRSFQKTIYSVGFEWQNVQWRRYRYLALVENYIAIRIVLSEFLFGEVIWSDIN